MVRAERKYQRVVQVGSQQRSIAINNFGSDLVRSGAIGRVHTVLCPNFIGPGLGAIFVGEKGKLEINRNKLAANPPELIRDAPPPADKSEYASVAHEHIRNWVHCMRTREKPVAHAEIGHRSTVICQLINICRELGRKLTWDPVREQFQSDDEANQLRSRPRRRGYELPEIV